MFVPAIAPVTVRLPLGPASPEYVPVPVTVVPVTCNLNTSDDPTPNPVWVHVPRSSAAIVLGLVTPLLEHAATEPRARASIRRRMCMTASLWKVLRLPATSNTSTAPFGSVQNRRASRARHCLIPPRPPPSADFTIQSTSGSLLPPKPEADHDATAPTQQHPVPRPRTRPRLDVHVREAQRRARSHYPVWRGPLRRRRVVRRLRRPG